MSSKIYSKYSSIKIILKGLKGKVDLVDVYTELNIYEDIFLPFTTAKLSILDTFDIPYKLPIFGDETVDIIVHNEQGFRKWKFLVYKLEKDFSIKQNESNKNLITLYLITPQEKGNLTNRPCQQYKGSANSIVQKVVNQAMPGKSISFHDNVTNLEFISNFWRPTEIINYVEEFTKTSTFHDFLFYENKKGLNYKSLSKLMQKPKFQDLTWKASNYPLFKRNDIISYEIARNFDLKAMSDVVQGVGSTYYRWHNINYKWYKEKNDFHSVSKFETNLGKKLHYPASWKNFNSEIGNVFDDEKQLERRELILRLLGKYHLNLKIGGDINRTIDQIYKIDYLIREKENPEVYNSLLKGLWFLSGIRHQFTADSRYVQNMRLMKKAFTKWPTPGMLWPLGPINTWG